MEYRIEGWVNDNVAMVPLTFTNVKEAKSTYHKMVAEDKHAELTLWMKSENTSTFVVVNSHYQ